MSSVSVIIPNYNGIHLLPACLDSLLGQTQPADEIIVVDDASTDGSVVLLRERYPQITTLVQEANGGFCRAANAGMRWATGDLLALLNNDVETEPRWLAELVAVLESRPDIGFCASRMLFHDRQDVINSAGLFLRVDGVGRDIGYGQVDNLAFAGAREVFGASGGAAVYRRAMLDDVGLFDEDLVAYGEDLDLSFRAQLRGWRCLYVPAATVYHHVGASYRRESPIKVYYSSRNMLSVLLKDMPGAMVRRHWPRMFAAQVYQVLYFSVRGYGRSVLRGKVAALRDIHGTLRKRKLIQGGRRIGDERLAEIFGCHHST